MYQPYALFYDASLIQPDHEKRWSKTTYDGFPDDRPPLKPRPVPAGHLRHWYVTIPVPTNATSGTYRALNEAGLKVGSACAPGYFEYAGRWVNYPILSGSLEPGTTARATVAKARAAGATVLSYAGPQLIYHDPFLYRLRTGLNLWNGIYDGWYPFTYAWGLDQHEDGSVVTTGRTGNFKVHGVVLVGRDRMIPQVEWPAMRQGVWDVRYATTLAAQVLKAREFGIDDPRVEEAEELLRRPLADKPTPEGIVLARRRMLDLIMGLRSSDPRLWPRKLGRGNRKELARRVNRWIRPDLSYREFPMGIEALREGLTQMRELDRSERPYRATMQGYELVDRIKKLREQGRINEVELAVAKARIGELLLKEEKKCLEQEEDAYKEHFRLVKILNEGWRFRPDRDDLGLKREWYRPGMDRSDWKPIDVRKFWQQQGRPDWQDLEGPRVGMKGIGWYHLRFTVPEDWEGRELYLWFNSDENARVYVNGELVRHRNEGAAVERWHTPSLAPLSDALKPGRINHIVIRVYNSAQAGGLWRGLMVLEPRE